MLRLPLVLLLTGCSSALTAPALELVLCDGATCPASGEPHRARGALEREDASGLHLRFALRRRSGATAELALELPRPRAGVTPAPPRISYVERLGGKTVFASSRVAGRLELSSDGDCPCQTGRLELLLVDAGPDGAVGSADDQVRRISQARLRLGERPFCHPAAALAIREDRLVVGQRACPAARSAAPSSAWGWSAEGELDPAWNAEGWYDEGWSGEWSEGAPACWDDGSGWDGDGGWTDVGASDVGAEPASESPDDDEAGWSDDGSAPIDDGSGPSDDSGGDDGSDGSDDGWTDDEDDGSDSCDWCDWW